MLSNFILNNYFIYTGKDLIISTSKRDFQNNHCNNVKNIIINNCDRIDLIDNVIDIRIFCWLLNNLGNFKSYSYLEKEVSVNRKEIISLSKRQVKLIQTNQAFLNQAKEYTRYYKELNSLFKIDYNKKYYFNLLQRYKAEKIKQEKEKDCCVEYTELAGLENFQDPEKRLKYNFLSSNGKIYNNFYILQNIDRKKYIELFKTDKDKKYYLIDFKTFEPSMFYYYIKGDKYIDENFYDRYAIKFNLSRKEFKIKFLSWIYGAGEKSLGEQFLINIDREFPELINLKNNISGGYFINYFGHSIIYGNDYKKLGYLINSTGGDFLLRFYDNLYYAFKDSEDIIFRFMLFDEFFIECKPDFDLKKLESFFMGFKYKIEEM